MRASIQRKRDSRKEQVIELHDSGLTVNEIKTKGGCPGGRSSGISKKTDTGLFVKLD